MKRISVESSDLASIGWEAGTLEIAFHRKKEGQPEPLYRYYDVPEQVFQALLRAKSKGREFNYRIKNRYRYERIDSRVASNAAV